MQAIPLSFFLFLAELAAGGLILTTILDWDGEVSAGFLFLNGIFLLGFLALGIWLRTVLPAGRLVDYAAGRAALDAEVWVWSLVALVTAAQLVCIRLDRRRAGRAIGVFAIVASMAAIGTSSAAYASPVAGGIPLAATLMAGALALGAVWNGMMLGHWYLVTPLLAPRPLLRLIGAMTAVALVQGVLATWALLGGGVTESVAWLFWLRIGVGIAIPLALALPIWRTARVRSMMSATGLLYVALGMMLSGEIIAKALFFLTGIPV